MEPSDDFEQFRVRQLLEQFGLHNQAVFWIVFGTLGEEPALDYASCFMPDSYKESGFFSLLLRLLDLFIEYRSQNEVQSDYHGIINIKFSEISIKWVDKDTAEAAISAFRAE